jgi:hypothetical protein
MKIFNSISKIILLSVLIFSCQPEEINVNTGPLFLQSFMAEGTDINTGVAIIKEIKPNESNVPIDAVITINFSKPIDPGSVAAVSFTQEGASVSSSITVNNASIVINPNNDLEFGTKYTIALQRALKSADGGMFLDDVVLSFTTEVLNPTVYDGQTLYMPFDGNYTEAENGAEVTVVGSPGFAGGLVNEAYAGASGAYLTVPTSGLLGTELTASFWMKINDSPDRAGVLVIGPPDPNNPSNPNNRNSGFRLFRENVGGKQRFKLNVGTGSSDSWFDGGAAADVDPNSNRWVHFAFTISSSNVAVYIDGEVASQGAFSGVSWAGCDILSIMSGAPRFTEWGHLSDQSLMDELRLFNKAMSRDDIKAIILEEGGYTPRYDGEVFYMPFEGKFTELVSKSQPSVVGTPGYAGQGVQGSDAYAGAASSYLTFPGAGLQNNAFSASFWLKINAVPDRAGILVMSKEDVNNPTAQNIRTSGFRFFRENVGGKQRFKLNVGNGSGDSWFDGGANADVDPATNEWVHFAFTISNTECVVYINGQSVSQGSFSGVDWTGCDLLSIMSGAPRFTEWGHHSDHSYMDELRIFDKALSQSEIQAIIDGD